MFYIYLYTVYIYSRRIVVAIRSRRTVQKPIEKRMPAAATTAIRHNDVSSRNGSPPPLSGTMSGTGGRFAGGPPPPPPPGGATSRESVERRAAAASASVSRSRHSSRIPSSRRRSSRCFGVRPSASSRSSTADSYWLEETAAAWPAMQCDRAFFAGAARAPSRKRAIGRSWLAIDDETERAAQCRV